MSAIDAGERWISKRMSPKEDRPAIPPESLPRENIKMARPEILRQRNPRQYAPRFEHNEQVQPKKEGIFKRGYGTAKSAYGTAKKAGETYYNVKRKYEAARQLWTDIQHERRHKRQSAAEADRLKGNADEALKDIEGVKYQEL